MTDEIAYETWKLDDLKPHPLQAELFGDLSDADLRALAISIRRDGLQHSIEILPDGTILAGHQRVRAITILRKKKVSVLVRNDLVAQGEDATVRRLVEDNLVRRQLTPLQQVRCIAQLSFNSNQTSPLRWINSDHGEHVARILNVSPKTADRLLRISQTPPEVQQAFELKKLPLVLACRVFGLSRDQQDEIAAQIAEKGYQHAKSIVAPYFGIDQTNRAPTVTEHYRSLIGSLGFAFPRLSSKIDEIEQPQFVDLDLETLTNASQLIDSLREKLTKAATPDDW